MRLVVVTPPDAVLAFLCFVSEVPMRYHPVSTQPGCTSLAGTATNCWVPVFPAQLLLSSSLSLADSLFSSLIFLSTILFNVLLLFSGSDVFFVELSWHHFYT